MRLYLHKLPKSPCPSCGKTTTLYRLVIMMDCGLGKSFELCRSCICETSYRLNEICGVEFPLIEKEGDAE